MSDPRAVATQELYRQWRNGDAAAGQGMAQRFSDWYYAVTASRLGDAHGRAPLQRTFERFQQGILEVSRESELVGWAHGILAEEMARAGGRIAGGDFPNPLTGGRSPTELIQAARAGLAPEEITLLAHAYDSSFPLAEVARLAESQGGMPLAVLRARARLKRWLRDNAGVAFTEVPDAPNLDHAPLPLYEAGRMQSAAEETGFEKWLLSNMGLCKDIAEFGVFALALRAGALRAGAPAGAGPAQPAPGVAASPPVPAPARAGASDVGGRPAGPGAGSPAAEPDPFADPFAEPPPRGSKTGLVVGGVAAVVVLLVLGALLLG